MRLLDASVRGLSARISEAVSAGDWTTVRNLTPLKKALLGRIDAINPEYAEARLQFGTAESRKDAFALGRRFTSQDPEDIEDLFKGNKVEGAEPYSAADKIAYYAGTRRKLSDLAEGMNDTANIGQNLWKDKYSSRLEAMLPSREWYDAMDTHMGLEQNMAKTDSLLKTSQTAPMAAHWKEMGGKTPGVLSKAAETAEFLGKAKYNPVGTLLNVAKGSNKIDPEQLKYIAGVYSKLMLSDDPMVWRNIAKQEVHATPWLGSKTSGAIKTAKNATIGASIESAKDNEDNQ